MIRIRNLRSLISAGNVRERELILHCLERAVESVSPLNLLNRAIDLKSKRLILRGHHKEFDLSAYDKIFVVGAGKASGLLAQALEHKLGNLVTAGYVNVLQATKEKFRTRRINLNGASHPVPNQAGVNGSRQIVRLLCQADARTLVICLISGGGSALLPLPAKGVTLRDIIQTTNLLLHSGANIDQMNCVRKHISAIKGGRLVNYARNSAFLSLIVSDVVGDHLESIASGPTVPDPSTFEDAKKILQDFKVYAKVSSRVKEIIEKGSKGLLDETPKPGDPVFSNVSNMIIGSNEIACQTLQKELHLRLGSGSKIEYLGSSLVGEASVTAEDILRKCVSLGKDPKKNCVALVWGGETTVTVKGKGTGGRNQEEALSALNMMQEMRVDATMSFFGTDGIDGKTSAAGAVVDLSTANRAKKKNLNIMEYLKRNDSNTFFNRVGNSLIVTGPTGTNVNDIGVAIVSNHGV